MITVCKKLFIALIIIIIVFLTGYYFGKKRALESGFHEIVKKIKNTFVPRETKEKKKGPEQEKKRTEETKKVTRTKQITRTRTKPAKAGDKKKQTVLQKKPHDAIKDVILDAQKK